MQQIIQSIIFFSYFRCSLDFLFASDDLDPPSFRYLLLNAIGIDDLVILIGQLGVSPCQISIFFIFLLEQLFKLLRVHSNLVQLSVVIGYTDALCLLAFFHHSFEVFIGTSLESCLSQRGGRLEFSHSFLKGFDELAFLVYFSLVMSDQCGYFIVRSGGRFAIISLFQYLSDVFFFFGLDIRLDDQSFFEFFDLQLLIFDLLIEGANSLFMFFSELGYLFIEKFFILGGLQLRCLGWQFGLLSDGRFQLLISRGDLFHQFLDDVVVLFDGDHRFELYCSKVQLLQKFNSVLMIFLRKVFFGLFIFFLYLFFKVEFAVNPHLPDYSHLKLVETVPESTTPKQVVLIIIDSLRNDYRGRMDFVKNYMQKHPENTFLAKSTVGNPTMTTQRIQSMMTGSQIFSSGNILKTFLASKVQYDNLISQLNSHNKTSTIFGDNTWVKLFDFSHSEICVNTFDVHDLDSCDRVVYDNLPQEIFRGGVSNFSSSFIIAHLLGLDHVGHSRSTIDDPMMDVKMKEISKFLEQVFEEADEETVFLVTGDHGMRGDGNHGGTSIDEVQTFLFGYSKGVSLFQEMKKLAVTHADITTTLSILLDIPLPNNAIGYPILNLLPKVLASRQRIVQINKNLYKHFSSMMEYYGLPLTVQQITKYQQKLNSAVQIEEMEILLQFLAQKLIFLKYSSPDPTRILTIACLLSLFAAGLLVYTFSKELTRGVAECKGRILAMLFCEGFPMFTLFISYFSWKVIQNLSDALVTGFLTAAIFGVLLNISTRNKLMSILCIVTPFVVLAQIEPDKSNDYRPSSLRVQSLNEIVTNKIFWGGVSSFLILYYIKTVLEDYQKALTQNPSSKHQTMIVVKVIIAFLSYTNYLFTHLVQKPIYEISIIQALIIIGYVAVLSSGHLESTARGQSSDVKFIVINFLSVFMGPHFPLILAVCLIIEQQVANCYNYAIIMSLLAKCIWWWLGNRYEYSGVDILKTYVYSQSYAIILNGVSLVIYLNSPFILNFVFVNCRLLSLRTQIQRYLMEGETIQYRWKLNLSLESESSKDQSEPFRQEFIAFMENSNMKYAGVLMLGLVSSIWTTLFNNQKILFTVVCVPVLVLITLITLSTLAMVVVVSYFYGRKRKDGYREVSLEHQ